VTKLIVVGYDGEEPAQRALTRAISDAKAVAGRLVVVVVAEMPVDPFEPPAFSVGPAVVTRPLEEPSQLEPITAEAMRQAEAAGVPADYVWDAGPDPARTIIDAARDNDADEIVLGPHHHTLLERFFGEDVAVAVKREANCDVVVVD
jgi:nucleotide-binding universal stress UspA family protein